MQYVQNGEHRKMSCVYRCLLSGWEHTMYKTPLNICFGPVDPKPKNGMYSHSKISIFKIKAIYALKI